MNSALESGRACKEQARLLRAFLLAAADYSRAVAVLRERSGVMPRLGCQRIRTFADETAALAAQARTALDKHSAEHGC